MAGIMSNPCLPSLTRLLGPSNAVVSKPDECPETSLTPCLASSVFGVINSNTGINASAHASHGPALSGSADLSDQTIHGENLSRVSYL